MKKKIIFKNRINNNFSCISNFKAFVGCVKRNGQQSLIITLKVYKTAPQSFEQCQRQVKLSK